MRVWAGGVWIDLPADDPERKRAWYAALAEGYARMIAEGGEPDETLDRWRTEQRRLALLAQEVPGE